MATGGIDKRRPSANEISKMKTADLRDSLKTALAELQAYDETEAELDDFIKGKSNDDDAADEHVGGTGGMLRLILKEIKAIRREKEETQMLRKELNSLKEVVVQQQKALEGLDARNRERNLIIMGLAEAKGAETDEERCSLILSRIGCEAIQFESTARLGKPSDDRKRPVLVKVETREKRDEILKNAKKLKAAGDDFKLIYIKKDVHPAVRKEWQRLKEAEKEEKRKPENQGCVIELDFKRRQLLRDGEIIDSWSPSYFQ